jgi:hypothetical protein
MAAPSSLLPWILAGVALVGVAAGVTVALWPEEPPPPVDPAAAIEADDAAPTRDETEDFMREIGYVQ